MLLLSDCCIMHVSCSAASQLDILIMHCIALQGHQGSSHQHKVLHSSVIDTAACRSKKGGGGGGGDEAEEEEEDE